MQHPLEKHTQDAERYTEAWGARYPAGEVSDDNQATEIGKLLIQSLLLLHGGGLIAVPAFAAVLAKPPNTDLLGMVILVLGIGLILTLIGGLMAFLALSSRSRSRGILVDAVADRAWARVFAMEHTMTSDPAYKDASEAKTAEANRIDATAKPDFKAYEQYRFYAIILVFASALCLFGAACVGAAALR